MSLAKLFDPKTQHDFPASRTCEDTPSICSVCVTTDSGSLRCRDFTHRCKGSSYSFNLINPGGGRAVFRLADANPEKLSRSNKRDAQVSQTI